MSLGHEARDVVEVETLRVDTFGVGGQVSEHGRVEVGAGEQAHRRALEQVHGAQREEIGRSRTGTDEVDGHADSFDLGGRVRHH